MRSYILITGDFVPWGGMDRANYELAWYLADQIGADVHLIAHNVAAPLADHPQVTWYKVKKPLNRYLLAEPLLRRTGLSVIRKLTPKGARVIANGGNCAWPDINWVHFAHCAWERKDSHAPMLFRMRAAWAAQRARKDERNALTMARYVIANSEATRQQLIEKLELSPSRVHTIYYGADGGAFHPPTLEEKQNARHRFQWDQNEPYAIFIGAIGHDRRKGFDLLFEAWKRLCKDANWDVNLAAFGNGAEVSYWREEAARNGIGNRVRMMGFSKEIPTAVIGADVLISPTHYEAYGLGVQEALCSGLPALVTRNAGVAEHYPPELSDFLLDDPPQVEDLVARLRNWRLCMNEGKKKMEPFSQSLRRRTWADMSREIIEFTGHL
jgi:glycosyltransferase involved in cell wall biosynthesis